jgi:RND family efflux transporter MFP subunit
MYKDGIQFVLKPVFIALCALCIYFLPACNTQPQSGATDIETPVSVRESKPTSSINRVINTSGTALATFSVDLNSEMSGLYNLQTNPRTGRLYKLGDAVKKGDLIIRLEDKEYENNQRIESRKLSLDIAEQEQVKQKDLYELGGATATQIRNTEIQITNATYDLANANINLNKMNVIAPFDGVIVNLPHYSPDVKIASNQPMVGIMNYSNLFMEISLPESTIGSIQVNQPVHITHSISLPYDTLRGVISELSPAISSETRTYKGKILIENAALKLRPGMFVKADVVVDRSEGVIVIPKSVLLSARNRRYVYVVERNLAIARTVVTGIENEDDVEILEGLHENDNLIIRGFETLRENSRVKVLR